MPPKIKKRFYLDYSILLPYMILCVIGIIMVYSAGSYEWIIAGEPAYSGALSQVLFFLISLGVISFIYKMKTKVFQNREFMMAGIGFISILLLLTKFTGLGDEVNGAQGWLKLPGIPKIQPSEFLKILIIWYLAFILAKRQTKIEANFKDAVLRPTLLVMVLIGLVAIQPDMGGAAILTLMTIVMLLASGISYKYTLFLGLGGVALSTLVIQVVIWTQGSFLPEKYQYIYQRFSVFRNPFLDSMGDGYHLINGYYAIFNGGWFGKGLGNGIQKKGFLFAPDTDFMFATVIEELGVIVATLILLLLLFLILRIFLVGIRAKSDFNALMSIGLGGMLLIQLFVNLGGIFGIIPLTGVTFPFLSAGGSSLLTLSIAIGFVLNISADEKRRRYMEMDHLEVLSV